MKRMLLIFAHPGDETYACGATIVKYVKAGWNVDLVMATSGEKGMGEGHDAPVIEGLGEVRKHELETAGEKLGIESITFLGYADGSLHTDPAGELEELLYKKMTELVPDIVITYDTSGINNNPDNKRLSYSATYAFQKFASWVAGQFTDMPEFDENSMPKLYYTCMPESVVSYLRQKKLFPGESYGRPLIGVDDKFITAVVSTSGGKLEKKNALRLYDSLSEEFTPFLAFKGNPLLEHEYYVMRYHGLREVFMGKMDVVSSKL